MSEDFKGLVGRLGAGSQERSDLLMQAYTALKASGRLSQTVLRKYRCKQHGCTLATVFQLPGVVACHVSDYRFSRGLNEQVSTPSGRKKNTLDGDRHWPERVYDVRELAAWGDAAGFDIVCPHHRSTLNALELLAAVEGVRPGHPARPAVL